MARSLPPREVQCYFCDHRFEVGGRAQSTSCPKCYKAVIVHDIEIKNQVGPKSELKTCGQIIIKKRGRLICQTVVAHNGLVCEGIIDARTVQSRTTVTLGPKSTFKGDLTAPAVEMAAGAKVKRSRFDIGRPPDPPAPPAHSDVPDGPDAEAPT